MSDQDRIDRAFEARARDVVDASVEPLLSDLEDPLSSWPAAEIKAVAA